MNAIGAILYRDYRQRATNLAFLFWDLFVPIAYLLLFGTGFDRTVGDGFVVEGRAIGYVTFLLPGVLAMTGFSVAMNAAWGFFMDKDSGIFYELLTYPITRRQLLVGKVAFNILLGLAGAMLAVALGAFAMGAQVLWLRLPWTVLAMAVTTAGWFFLLSAFAIRLRRMDSFNTFTSASYILFMFLSSMFYPMEGLPRWFQAVSMGNPMTWQVDLLRYTLSGVGTLQGALLDAALFGLFTLTCLAFAARSLDEAA